VDARTGVAPLPTAPHLGGAAQLSDSVAAYVRYLIMSGRVKAGEFLRLEKLAADLGVSATPVREGLLSLRGEGFVELVARRGFMVSPLSRQDVLDIFMVQADISGELAARAARRATPAQIRDIQDLQAKLEASASLGDIQAQGKYNHVFHRTVNRCAASDKLMWLIHSVSRYAPDAFFGDIEGWQQASITDHRDIVEALTRRDEDAARAASRYHLIHAGEILIRHLDEEIRFWEPSADAQ
jgi:DNA-binding GntR family transcriptional regulator